MTEPKPKVKSKPFAVVTNRNEIVKMDVLSGYEVASRDIQNEFKNQYDVNQLARPKFDPEELNLLLLANVHHASCITVKSIDTIQDYSIVPLNDDYSESDKKILENFYNNLSDDFIEIFRAVTTDYLSTGYGTFELLKPYYNTNKPPFDINHIPSFTIRIAHDRTKYLQRVESKSCWFKAPGIIEDLDKDNDQFYDVWKNMGIDERLPFEKRASELVMFKGYNANDLWYGVPNAIPTVNNMESTLAIKDYNRTFYEHHGMPTGILMISGDYEEGETLDNGKTELEDMLEDSFDQLVENPGTILEIAIKGVNPENPPVVSFQPLNINNSEGSFNISLDRDRDEILSAHRVPPYRLGIMIQGSLAGNLGEESTEIYNTSVIEPTQRKLNALQNKFIIRDGFHIENLGFELQKLDTRDLISEVQISVSLFNMGVITPNQLILRFADYFGLETVDHPAMDAHYINGTAIDADIEIEDAVNDAMVNFADSAIEAIKGDSEVNERNDISESNRVSKTINSLKGFRSSFIASRK